MTPGFSMMGSGIYSEDVDREIVCAERCNDCADNNQTCDAVWEENPQPMTGAISTTMWSAQSADTQ
jgi:hypothetical protein